MTTPPQQQPSFWSSTAGQLTVAAIALAGFAVLWMLFLITRAVT
jgi:hypothetical protein